MQRLLQIFILISSLPGFTACSVIDDVLLTEEVGDFSRGVVALSAIITKEFALAEEINTLGFTDNLKFQFELGGNPDTNLKPLFSASDTAARQSVLTALNGYAETLAAVASGKSLSSEYSKLVGTGENLKELSSGNFNLAHSLSFLDSKRLMSLTSSSSLLPSYSDTIMSHAARKHMSQLDVLHMSENCWITPDGVVVSDFIVTCFCIHNTIA